MSVQSIGCKVFNSSPVELDACALIAKFQPALSGFAVAFGAGVSLTDFPVGRMLDAGVVDDTRQLG